MSELRLEQRVAVPPSDVFAAMEDPFRLRRWYGAPPGGHRLGAEGDVGAGEPFRVHVIDARGERFTQSGRVLEVSPGAGLALEMTWDGGPYGREVTRASLRLHPEASGTRIEVHQGPFSDPRAMEAHREYWEANLGRLARVAAGEPVPCFEEFWEESQGFSGPLGAATHAVLAGLREAGAAPDVVAQVEDALYTHLARLPADVTIVLSAVLRARLRD
ncbi:SRPBCC domain-containing protein [Myxococcaceae bacterium JPH2]|nr:SRPBCC domain-containing protein [Myxococcaceae bacterium JPH2]